MSWVLLVPAFLIGIACGIFLAYHYAKRAWDEAKRAAKQVAEAEGLMDPLVKELEHAKWCLGGRIRKPTDPPIYLMPPGHEKTGCCDDARLAWMEIAEKASKILRATGMDDTADGIHPTTQFAHQKGLESDREKYLQNLGEQSP